LEDAVNLYLRLLKLLFLLPFVRRRGLLDSGRIAYRVWSNDCDMNLHLNNGRYLTFMDLGRVHLLAQTGLLGKLLQKRWTPVLSAVEVNYLRPIRPFQKFDLGTRLLTWDDKYFYMEQRFVAGGQLCAVALVKGLFLHRGKRVPSHAILAALRLDSAAPDMPEMVRHWNGLSVLKKQHLN
jgi:acyl-CoA thioesterase FadM